MKKRFLAMLLVVCMVLSITPTSTFAEISPQVGEGNVCTHHLHDENCGYTQALAQVDCDKNCTDTNDDGVIDHTADCAYSPAVAANPCNFDVTSCEICHPKTGETADAGTALPTETPALPSETPVLAKTDAPTTAMATVAKETATQPSVSFVLDNQTAYADTATWAVYDSETSTTAREDVMASCNANTLTLAHKTDLPVAVYYVAVTEGGKAESARLALTVEGNVAPVALLGAAANAGEIKLTTDVKTLVSGTTYTVETKEQLAHLASLVNTKNNGIGCTVKMLNDIVLPNSNWTPIGTRKVSGNQTLNIPFSGTFDGGGFEVQNLIITNGDCYQGLFGYLGDRGIVQNVGVTGNISGKDCIGGVVGLSDDFGTVQNCYSTVTVRGTGINENDDNGIGGVVGNNKGNVQNCYNTGNVTSSNKVGGITGVNKGNGIIKNCYNTGNVIGENFVGGVVAFNFSTVQNCYNTGTVSGTSYVGGVVGCNLNQVENCVSLGAGNTGSPAGRVVGLNDAMMGGSPCTLANNKARSDMLVNNEIVTGGLADNTNGENVIVGDSTKQTDVFTIANGWETTIWTIPADKLVAGATLPTLTGFKNAQNPKLPSVVKEEPKPLDDSITTLESDKFYTVETKDQLARLAILVNDEVTDGTGYTVKMQNDINLLNSEWTPIGTGVKPFAGAFDGCGFEVKTLNITGNADKQGLFGVIGTGGVVQNVGVTGTVSGNDCVGGVAGINGGVVQNCYSTVNVSGTENVGGVVGYSINNVKNCYSTGNVTGNNNVGGVVGYAGNGSIQNCYNTGTVTGGTSIGGVVGKTNGANVNVIGCVSLGSSVMCSNGSTATNFGRVIGLNDGGNPIYPIYNKARSDMLVNNATVTDGLADNTNGADVTVGTANQTEVFSNASGWIETVWTIPTGALVANEALPTLKGFTSTQNPKLPAAAERDIPLEASVLSLETDKTYTVSDATQLAKLASLVNDTTADGTNYIVRLTANINLNGNTNWTPIGTDTKPFVGTFDGNGFEVQNLTIADGGDYQGLFGVVGSGTVKDLGVTGNVSGSYYVSGVVGWNNGGTIQNCHSTVTVSGTDQVVGIAAKNNGIVEKCYNAGTINGGSNTSGVVGWNDGGTIQNCYNTGTINGIGPSGGVVAYNKGTLQNCYNTGNVNGTENVGGIAGDNTASNIQNCYNTGTVTGTDLVGGVIGCNDGGNAYATNCVSLGLAVLRTGGGNKITFGRIIGSRDGTNDRGNKARSDLYVIDGTVTGGALDDINGEPFDVGDSTTQASVFTAAMGFTPTNGWNEISGNLGTDTLPTLAGFVSTQNPKVPQKANISDSITFANGTAVYDGNVQTLENAITTATGGNFTYTYAAEPGSSLDNNMPKSAGTYNVTASYTSATETGSKTATFTITAKELTTATVTVSNDNFIYDGKAKRPTVTVKDGDTTLVLDTDYVVGYADNRNAGTATVTVGFDGNYSGTATATFTIGKSPIAVSSGTVTAKTYDGTKTAEVTALDFHVLASGETFTTDDYTVGTPNFSDANVGTGKTVTGIATLVANEKTNNYTLTDGAYTLTNGEITKGTYTAPPTKTISIKNGAERTGTITLADIFGANIPADGAFGTVTAPISNKIMKTVVKNSGGSIDYTSNNNALDEGRADIYKVNVTTTNYTDFDVNITFQAIDKTAVAISGLTAETNLVYNGKQQKGCTGTATVEGNKVPVAELMYTYTGTNGTTYNETTAPKDAGSYKLVVAINPTNADYTGKHTDINFAIGKAPLTITATSYETYQYKPAPDLSNLANTLTFDGFVNGEGITNLTATYSADYANIVDTNNAGTTDINIGLSGTETNNNYAITLTKGLLTVCVASPSGDVSTTLPTTATGTPSVVAEATNPSNQLRLIIANLMPSELADASAWLDRNLGSGNPMEAHELELQVSDDNGITWRAATMTDLKSGNAKAVLPIPTNASPLTDDLLVYHFINGTDKAPTLEPAVYDATLNAAVATVTGFSPFVVVAVPKSVAKPVAPPAQSNNNNNTTVIDHENNFWISVVALIQSAKKGDVLKIDTGAYTKMPACVMEELRIKGAGMIIKWNDGKDIVIPVGKALGAEKNRDIWTLAQLAEMYGKYTVSNKTNPNTGVESFGIVDNQTGVITPITGNIVDATTTQGSQTGKYILVMVAGTLIVAVTVFGVCIWARKKEKEEE